MRLCLINPSNPLATVVRVNQNRWNRFRVWKPLNLMVLAGLTPPEWEISIVDENLGDPDDGRQRVGWVDQTESHSVLALIAVDVPLALFATVSPPRVNGMIQGAGQIPSPA